VHCLCTSAVHDRGHCSQIAGSDLVLVGTAEIPLVGMHSSSVFSAVDLPVGPSFAAGAVGMLT
jgi:seryl-tRNA synthetase